MQRAFVFYTFPVNFHTMSFPRYVLLVHLLDTSSATFRLHLRRFTTCTMHLRFCIEDARETYRVVGVHVHRSETWLCISEESETVHTCDVSRASSMQNRRCISPPHRFTFFYDARGALTLLLAQGYWAPPPHHFILLLCNQIFD